MFRLHHDRSICVLLLFLMFSCAKKNDPDAHCADQQLFTSTGSQGTGQIFNLDPMISSNDPSLSPASSRLDSFRSSVTLSHLGGRGVLEGQYVDVRNGMGCGEWFGAFDSENRFEYSHSDGRFQEVMSYHYGDRYRASLDAIGYLAPSSPVEIVAHCELDDNSFFYRNVDPSTHQITREAVCLGDSVVTPSASYADDASVVVHELQHATTMDSYSTRWDLGTFFWDEGGALNEAISDFMSLLDSAPEISSPFDPRIFSRWALGAFIPGSSAIRGAHKCPVYDPSFPSCTGFPSFSASSNTISYVYPDGLSWPYANNYDGPGYVSSAFRRNRSQEEIHEADVLMVGALWDVYEALKNLHPGNEPVARAQVSKIVLEAIRQLPTPTLAHHSPVTFRGFAQAMVDSSVALAYSSQEQTAVVNALTQRGLLAGSSVEAGWAVIGTGTFSTPGLQIEDDPTVLKPWVMNLGFDPSLVKQGISTGLNHKLDPGELVAVWFDIKNVSAVTAGGLEVTVSSSDPELSFFDERLNPGAMDAGQAQIRYHKVNGTAIVSALSATDPLFHVPTGNSYFLTNPFFARDWRTAIWVQVSSTAAHGKTVTFHVQASPTNGSADSLDFTAVIN